ncbi:MAG: hypothetical protein ABIH42_03960 [Planctomycetota bacterium]
MEEAQLLSESVSGHKDSLRLLLEKYHKAASAIAFAVCGRSDWAKESAALGLAATGSSIGAVNSPEEFGSYLISVVQAESKRFLSDKRRPLLTPEGAKLKIKEAAQKLKTPEKIPQRELNNLIITAFLGLSDKSRELLALSSYYNNSYQELERLIGISADELEEQLCKARIEFSEIFSEIYT